MMLFTSVTCLFCVSYCTEVPTDACRVMIAMIILIVTSRLKMIPGMQLHEIMESYLDEDTLQAGVLELLCFHTSTIGNPRVTC